MIRDDRVTLRNSALATLTRRSDVLVALGVVGVLVMMIMPLPPALLDVLLALNIAIGLTVLLVAIYNTEPLQFSVFPGMLLMITLFRLALNVASTRLILGDGYAGQVISAFGGFVVKGNYIVGFIVFLILVLINFIVITKGAGRVAEVAARFTLDAMPGKQMAIDADLNNGIIDEQEARRRREKISREADFYGAMDGASKFVRGDAIASLIITAINILGGFAIGMIQLGMSFPEAIANYTLLTVGDGLVNQIPALIVSTSAGIIVTRAGAQNNFGHDVTAQLFSRIRPLFIVAAVLMFFALVPGLPALPFMILSLLVGGIAFSLRSGRKAEQLTPELAVEEEASEEKIEDFLYVDPMEIEIGYGLIPLVDVEQNGDLLNRITLIRKQQALDLGIIIPPIRIRDNIQLKPEQYTIKIRGIEIAQGEIKVGYYLALNAGEAGEEIEGFKTTEPTFGMPATWIRGENRERAELLGYAVIEAAAVLATHLVDVIQKNSWRILGRQDAMNLVENIKKDNPALIDELYPNLLSLAVIHKVLQKLLRESIPIRDLTTILETLADYAPNTKDVEILTEYARFALNQTITRLYQHDDGRIYCMTLDPELEEMFNRELEQTAQGRALSLTPEVFAAIIRQIRDHAEQLSTQGRRGILLTAPTIRPYLRKLLESTLPDISLVSYSELMPTVEVESIGVVTHRSLEGKAAPLESLTEETGGTGL
ncbi:MAG: flagellar biosynthesis protein FlhA [Candidatus Delongbacteria bacterium]|nr:flagellar biosynthesis protein FlhA [Candidatus Delongbacteria bacterium]